MKSQSQQNFEREPETDTSLSGILQNKPEEEHRREIRVFITNNFSREEIGVIWFDFFATRMHDDIGNREKSGCVVELISRAKNRSEVDSLIELVDREYRSRRRGAEESVPKPGNHNLPPKIPRLGLDIYKFCDRDFQEHQFEAQFKININDKNSHVYIVHGHKKEGHSSLVERFLIKYIQKYANHKYGNEQGVVDFKKITNWNYIGDIQTRERRLLNELFKQWQENYEYLGEPYTADKLSKLISSEPKKIIVLQHDISLSKSDAITINLLVRYIAFWKDVLNNDNAPKLFLFFNIKYPPVGGINKLLPEIVASPFQYFNQKRIRNSLQKAVLQLPAVIAGLKTAKEEVKRLEGDRTPVSESTKAQGLSFMMLEELHCVTREKVMEWFEKYEIDDEDVVNYREKEINSMFMKDGKSVNKKCLEEIEPSLRKIIKDFK